jgi:signal transduction histidine kinase
MTGHPPVLFEALFERRAKLTAKEGPPGHLFSLPGPEIEALREALLPLLLDKVPGGVAVFDRELRYVLINDALASMNRLPPAAHLGRKLREVLPGTSLEFAMTIQRVFDTGEPIVNLTVDENVLQGMEQRHWLASYYRLSKADGRPLGIVALVTEISAQERAEARLDLLLEASEVLGASLDHEITLSNLARLLVPKVASFCIVDLLDSDGSPRAVEIAHLEPSMVAVAAEFRRRYPPGPEDAEGLGKVLRTGQSVLFQEISDEMLQRGATNAEHLALLRALGMRSVLIVPLTARSRTFGAITLISTQLGVRYDPTDVNLVEKLASRAALAIDNARLYADQQRQRQAAERAAARIGQLQALTSALSEAVTPEHVAEVTVGPGAAMIGASASALYSLEDQGDRLELRTAVGYDEASLERYRSISPDADFALSVAVRTGKIVVAHASEDLHAYPALKEGVCMGRGTWAAIPLLLRGQALGAIALGWTGRHTIDAEDETFMLTIGQTCAQALDRARLYEQERRVRKAREEFLAIVSHDLRNPLGVLSMSAALTARGAPPGPEGNAVRRRAEIMTRATQRMEGLIRDLLDAASLESGRFPLSLEDHDGSALIAEAADLFDPLASPKSIELAREGLAERCPVRCDRERVLQVLSNLVGNALKFTPEGGRIGLSAWASPGGVVFTVSDNGPGIDPAERQQIFDRFWTGRGKAGVDSGLGLYIAKGIVEAHRGRIWVESEVGAGSRFSFLLPALPAPSAA